MKGIECNIEYALAEQIGDGGLCKDAFEKSAARARAAAERLIVAQEAGTFPLGNALRDHNGPDSFRQMSDHLLANTTDLVVLGIGGSSLGAQTLLQTLGWGCPGYRGPRDGTPDIHFLENLDAASFHRLIAGCDLRTTRFLVISKSGGTAETVLQMLTAMEILEAKGGGKYMAQHFAVVTEPADNPLRSLAAERGFPVIDHASVGGRFSVISPTGLLPAHLGGVDIAAVAAAAAAQLDAVKQPGNSVEQAAAVTIGLMETRKVQHAAITCYDDRLQRFGLWFRQLWAESLGKDGIGATPLVGLGPVDQHSQLQLYLAGPNDKLHTIVTTDPDGDRLPVSAGIAGPQFAAYEDIAIQDLANAEALATIQTLVNAGRPVRRIHLGALTPENLGALLMHFMLETILVADMLGIDPFDQPAVEEGKKLARDFLSKRS